MALRKHLLPRFGSTPVGGIDRGAVQRWVNDHSKTHAARTVKRDYGVLRAVMAFAVDRELIGRTLRRANATGLVAGGVDVRTGQARLGHCSGSRYMPATPFGGCDSFGAHPWAGVLTTIP